MRFSRTRMTVSEAKSPFVDEMFTPSSSEQRPTSLELLSECQAEAEAMRELQAQLKALLVEIQRERNAWRQTAGARAIIAA